MKKFQINKEISDYFMGNDLTKNELKDMVSYEKVFLQILDILGVRLDEF